MKTLRRKEREAMMEMIFYHGFDRHAHEEFATSVIDRIGRGYRPSPPYAVGAMQDAGCELPRSPILRASVNSTPNAQNG
jgi:hypothetical protein